MAERILIIEDETKIADFLRRGLAYEGYKVELTYDGESGLKAARDNVPDLVILDVMLPGLDGLEVARRLRSGGETPILMLTAKDTLSDKVKGFDSGADDYLVKPFSFRELVARVRAILRRRELERGTPAAPNDRLVQNDLILDRTARRVMRSGKPVELTTREFDLLDALMQHAGQAQARQELLDRVWGPEWIGDPRTLDVHIRWLREKIEDDPSAPQYIETVRGFGYRFAQREA